MKLKERMCQKCKGTGIENVGDEWIGRAENKCPHCNEGIYYEGFNGYQVFELVPEKFLIHDKGDMAILYVKRSDGIYRWASWSVGLIIKVEEEYKQLPNIDVLEELGNLEFLIALFYYSDEPHIYCEGTTYTELDEGYYDREIS